MCLTSCIVQSHPELEHWKRTALSEHALCWAQVKATVQNGNMMHAADMLCSISFDRDDEYFATAGVSRRIKVKSCDPAHVAAHPVVLWMVIWCLCWRHIISQTVVADCVPLSPKSGALSIPSLSLSSCLIWCHLGPSHAAVPSMMSVICRCMLWRMC